MWWFQVNSEVIQPYICMHPFPAKPPSHPGCHTTLSTVSSHSIFGWAKFCSSVWRVEVFSLNWELLKSIISCFLPRKYLLLLLSLWVIGIARVQPPSKPTTSGLDWLHCAHIVSSHRPLCVASSGWENSNFSFFLFKPTMKPLRNSRDWSKFPPFPKTPAQAPLSLTRAPLRLHQRDWGSPYWGKCRRSSTSCCFAEQQKQKCSRGWLLGSNTKTKPFFVCVFVRFSQPQTSCHRREK